LQKTFYDFIKQQSQNNWSCAVSIHRVLSMSDGYEGDVVGAALRRPPNRFGRGKLAPTGTRRSELDHSEGLKNHPNYTGRQNLDRNVNNKFEEKEVGNYG
jgi:hypothetical protein